MKTNCTIPSLCRVFKAMNSRVLTKEMERWMDILGSSGKA